MMVLPNLILPSRVNQRWTETGLDSYDNCPDKNHFLSYPYPVTYQYNSRGFRDREWPESEEELKNAIWCIGDSFTVGLGSPVEHTWTYILEKKLNKQVINVSMDGASNEWIARRALDIYYAVKPNNMIIMWSYFHRRESTDTSKSDEQRRIFNNTKAQPEDDIENFLNCVDKVNDEIRTNCIHVCIPNSGKPVYYVENLHQQIKNQWDNVKETNWPGAPPVTFDEYINLPKTVLGKLESDYTKLNDRLKLLGELVDYRLSKIVKNSLGIVPQLDWARDRHHFDVLTSQWVVDKVCQTLNC